MNNIITSKPVKVYNTGMSAQIAQAEAIAKNTGLADLKTWSFSEIHVANTLIQKGIEEGNPVTHKRLHMFIYLVYGYVLVHHNTKIGEFLFQPWDQGPTVDRVYQAMKVFGSQPITYYCEEFDPTDFYLREFIIAKKRLDIHQVIDEAWGKYRKLKLYEIASDLHHRGSAWHKARIAHKLHLDIADIREDFIKIAT